MREHGKVHSAIYCNYSQSDYLRSYTLTCVFVYNCSVYFRRTWSLHQYQVASMVSPRVIPGQGRSPVTAFLNRCIASGRGRWQVLLGMILLGTAMLYTCSRLLYPPILLKAVKQEHTSLVSSCFYWPSLAFF